MWKMSQLAVRYQTQAQYNKIGLLSLYSCHEVAVNQLQSSFLEPAATQTPKSCYA
jgi:hypothetical protein